MSRIHSTMESDFVARYSHGFHILITGSALSTYYSFAFIYQSGFFLSLSPKSISYHHTFGHVTYLQPYHLPHFPPMMGSKLDFKRYFLLSLTCKQKLLPTPFFTHHIFYRAIFHLVTIIISSLWVRPMS